MEVGSSQDMQLQVGLVLELISPKIRPFNGAFPLLSLVSLPWLCCYAVLGFQNHLDGVRETLYS